MGASDVGFQDRDLVGGLERGLAVIEAFDAARPRMSLSDVAAATGLTRASARRYLLTLTKLGYADFDGKFFSLTPRVLRLGYAYLSSTALPARIQPFLERLSEETGESCSAAALDGGDVVYVARSATRRIMSIGLGVGSRLPAYCTSLGRAMLSAKDDAEIDAYLRTAELRALTPKTKIDPAALRAAVMEARAKGYALIDEELELGLRSLAVPIFDGAGRAVCAVNIGVQASRMTAEQLVEALLPALLRLQDELRRIV